MPDPPEKEEITINKIIAKMSWTNKNPIEIFPYNFSISFLSDSSFMMMIVLLNVKAIAMYRETNGENPRKMLIRKPIREVKIICPTPVIRETFPTSLIIFGLRLIPTIKSRNVTPICEKTLIVSAD